MQDKDLALQIDRFMRAIHFGLQERAPGFDREGVGPGGGIVLMTLADAGQISLNALTKRVARDKSQMTRMIRALEAKGLLTREISPEDKRVSLVSLTPKGAEVVDELTEVVAEVVGEILAPLSPAETQRLKDLFARVI